MSDGTTVVLIDPYLSRLRRVTPNDDVLPGDTRKLFNRDDAITKADYIILTHTHSDHGLDLPYIALKTGAMVIGRDSTCTVARAYGVPHNKLVSVKGGEDLQLGPISIRVIPSLHGVLRQAPNAGVNAAPATGVPGDIKAPL